jgi:dipeptidase
MACTTILVGKKASYDGSTMIARNDDSPSGQFHVKRMVVVKPSEQMRKYKSKISGVKIDLPDNPLRYTMMPNVDKSEGIRPAAGVNSANVGMTATETITSNPRVLGADPYVEKRVSEGGRKTLPGGIGEEDLLVLVLPYIHSAKEGVIRLGSLLEKYGTYEPNGIAFSDKDEIWWLETIGGHHFIAKRVPDDRYVSMPNQFGLDEFDFDDAFGAQKENICSPDLRQFINENHLDLNLTGKFNPRLVFGSHEDSDHVYNTPRSRFIERYLNPKTYKWDGDGADFNPESDDIPRSLVPERKITVDDVKYLLSSHYQGTPYDPYGKSLDPTKKNVYRSIGVNRTSFLALIQIRPYVPCELAAIEWVTFGSNVFNALVPLYANVDKIPEYFKNTTMSVDTNSFYRANRIIGALADPHFASTSIHIERYQDAVASEGYRLLNKTDVNFINNGDISSLEKANEEISSMVKKESQKVLDKVLYIASLHMKNAYSRSDN